MKSDDLKVNVDLKIKFSRSSQLHYKTHFQKVFLKTGI